MINESQTLRIAAAVDYLHGEFKLAECDQITEDMWREAFAACGKAPNFFECGVDVGISENLLHRENLLAFASDQQSQLTPEQWGQLGA